MDDRPITSGERIQRFREAKGWSRDRLASLVLVDVTAVRAWEIGKYKPRPEKRLRLAQVLGITLDELFPPPDAIRQAKSTLHLIDGLSEFARALVQRTDEAERRIETIRSSPLSAVAAGEIAPFQSLIARRVLAGELALDQIEVVYTLSRFKEIAKDIFRFQGQPHRVTLYCGAKECPTPGPNAFLFDETEALLDSFGNGEPAMGAQRMSTNDGQFAAYLRQIWAAPMPGGLVLSDDGTPQLDALRVAAIRLGLPEDDWAIILNEARRPDTATAQAIPAHEGGE